MNDRFKFRVWDKREKRYIEAPSPTPLLQADGLLAYFTNHPEYMENYDVQFCTGLKDKNGFLIYEGDIVEIVPEEENAQIIWDNDLARFQIDYLNDNVVADFDNFYSYELEVIGNIYENKELLNE